MQLSFFQVTLLVADYDDAINFYVNKLGFLLLEDTKLSDTKRWVRVAPWGNNTAALLLAKAGNENQLNFIGNQTGGRVFLFMHTSNAQSYFDRLTTNQVQIVRNLSDESFGKVFVFADLYGNLWDVIEPTNKQVLLKS